MDSNGVVLALRQTQNPPVQAPARRFDNIVQFASSTALLVCVILISFVVLPGYSAVSARLDRHRADEVKRAADEHEQQRIGEHARQRYIEQQSELNRLQKQTRDLTELNAKLADELNRKLKERQ